MWTRGKRQDKLERKGGSIIFHGFHINSAGVGKVDQNVRRFVNALRSFPKIDSRCKVSCTQHGTEL